MDSTRDQELQGANLEWRGHCCLAKNHLISLFLNSSSTLPQKGHVSKKYSKFIKGNALTVPLALHYTSNYYKPPISTQNPPAQNTDPELRPQHTSPNGPGSARIPAPEYCCSPDS